MLAGEEIILSNRNGNCDGAGSVGSPMPIKLPEVGIRNIDDGAPGRIRTCDFQLRRLTLYPLSYGRTRAEP
jgi:hypothetical protein